MGRFLCEYELVEIKSMMITRSSVLQFEVLIWKLPTVDGLSSSAIVVSEISSLKARVLVKSGTTTTTTTTPVQDDSRRYKSRAY